MAGEQDIHSAFSALPSDVINYIGVLCSDIILSRFGNNWQIDTTKPNTARECELSCRKFTSFIPMCKPDTIFQAQCDLSEKEFKHNPHRQENSLGKPAQLVEFIRTIKGGGLFIERDQKIIYDPEYELFDTCNIKYLKKRGDYHDNAQTLAVITLPIKTSQNIKISIKCPKDTDDQTCERINLFAIYCINKISEYNDKKTVNILYWGNLEPLNTLNHKFACLVDNLESIKNYDKIDILERLMEHY